MSHFEKEYLSVKNFGMVHFRRDIFKFFIHILFYKVVLKCSSQNGLFWNTLCFIFYPKMYWYCQNVHLHKMNYLKVLVKMSCLKMTQLYKFLKKYFKNIFDVFQLWKKHIKVWQIMCQSFTFFIIFLNLFQFL